MKRGRHVKKHDFLKRVVVLCLVMMVLLTGTVVYAAIRFETGVDSGCLGILMGGWCGELLLTLLKRKFETEDRRNSGGEETNTNIGNEVV